MEKKKLYRYDEEGTIAGVAAGLARYFGIDVTLVRLLFVLLTVAGGPGIILYIILVLIMPEAPQHVYDTYDTYA